MTRSSGISSRKRIGSSDTLPYSRPAAFPNVVRSRSYSRSRNLPLSQGAGCRGRVPTTCAVVQLLRYSLILDSDEDRVSLTIWLPTLRRRPRLRFLRTVAEVYSLAAELNAEGRRRFGLDVVAVSMGSDDGDISITFELDPDFSDAFRWRDEIATSAARIIAKNGGSVDNSYSAP
jgi:hypothetical protein